MPQASAIRTDIGAQQRQQLAIGDPGIGALNGLTLELGQSSAITGGSDITEATTTSYTPTSGGGYGPVSLTAGTNVNVTLSGGTVKLVIDSQQVTASGGTIAAFDQMLLVADVGGTKYVWAQWPTDAERTVVDGQNWFTGTLEIVLEQAP
jgi:hypothetical protein